MNTQSLQDSTVLVTVSQSFQIQGTNLKWNGKLQQLSPYQQIEQTASQLEEQLSTIGKQGLQHSYQQQIQQAQQMDGGGQQGQQRGFRERRFAGAGGGGGSSSGG